MTRPAPTRAYEEGLRQGELRYQRCATCSAAVFYPRTLCPSCGGTDLGWRTSSGRGVVYSATTVAERSAPDYNVSLVDLDEGFRMMSRVVGNPGQVRIGQRVRVGFDLAGDEPVAVFEPEEVP